MSFSSRTAEHLKALCIAGKAFETSKRAHRLNRCRALLKQLDPDKPPAASQAREFQWQYRALRERVHLYSETLGSFNDPEQAPDSRLRKTEWALELSLQYFRNVLAPAKQPGDDDDSSDNGA